MREILCIFFVTGVVLTRCGHGCCKTGVLVKEKPPPPPIQRNESCMSFGTGVNSETSSSGGGSDDWRHCAMSREVEKGIKDMHAKAGTATPSLRGIKVLYI